MNGSKISYRYFARTTEDDGVTYDSAEHSLAEAKAIAGSYDAFGHDSVIYMVRYLHTAMRTVRSVYLYR